MTITGLGFEVVRSLNGTAMSTMSRCSGVVPGGVIVRVVPKVHCCRRRSPQAGELVLLLREDHHLDPAPLRQGQCQLDLTALAYFRRELVRLVCHAPPPIKVSARCST